MKLFKINRAERKFIKPAVVYGWRIEESVRGTLHWEEDTSMPVKNGPMLDSLVGRGLLVNIGGFGLKVYSASPLAMKLKCGKCSKGTVCDPDSERLSECPDCEGHGVLLVNQR
jgi:hypothetical protein